MLSLSQYLNEILKQVQNDSVRQNGAEFTLTRIPTTHFVRREFYPLPQGERVFCSNPSNPSTLQLSSLFLPLTLTLPHKGRGDLLCKTNPSTFHLFNFSTLLTPHPSPLTLHFTVRPLTLTLSHTAYSLTRLILRLFELASHKGRGDLLCKTNPSPFHLFNFSPLLTLHFRPILSC